MASSDNNNDYTAAVVSLLHQAESLLSGQSTGQSLHAQQIQTAAATDMNIHRNENRINTSNGASIGTQSQSSTLAVEDRALANFRQLFAPYSNSRMPSPLLSASLGRGRVRALTDPAKKRKKSNPRNSFVFKDTWTHEFLCLASHTQNNQPSRADKLALQDAGLGRKTITFGRNDNAHAFVLKIETVYPKIKAGGGFELLRSGVSNKELVLITPPSSGYTVPFLRESSGIGQALIYVRPMQSSLPITASVPVLQVY